MALEGFTINTGSSQEASPSSSAAPSGGSALKGFTIGTATPTVTKSAAPTALKGFTIGAPAVTPSPTASNGDSLDTLNASYKTKTTDFSSKLSNYQNDLKAYNDQVDFWNKQGNIDPETSAKLDSQRLDLHSRFDQLNLAQSDINSMVPKINDLSKKKAISDYIAQGGQTISEDTGTSTKTDPAKAKEGWGGKLADFLGLKNSDQLNAQDLNIQVPFTPKYLSLPTNTDRVTGGASPEDNIVGQGVSFIAGLSSAIIQAIPKAVTTGTIEVGNDIFNEGKASTVDLGGLGYFLNAGNPKYTTTAQSIADKMKSGNGILASYIGTVSEKTLDVAFGAQVAAQGFKFLSGVLAGKAGDSVAKIEAWKTLGYPKTAAEATANYRALVKQFTSDAANPGDANPLAYKTLTKARSLLGNDIPSIMDTYKANGAKYAEFISRQTDLDSLKALAKPDLSLKGEINAKKLGVPELENGQQRPTVKPIEERSDEEIAQGIQAIADRVKAESPAPSEIAPEEKTPEKVPASGEGKSENLQSAFEKTLSEEAKNYVTSQEFVKKFTDISSKISKYAGGDSAIFNAKISPEEKAFHQKALDYLQTPQVEEMYKKGMKDPEILEDFYKKNHIVDSNEKGVENSDPLSSLKEEARKYSSAEEFADHYLKNKEEIPISTEYKQYLAEQDSYVKREKEIYSKLNEIKDKYRGITKENATSKQLRQEKIDRAEAIKLQDELDKVLRKKTLAKSPDVPIKIHIGDKELKNQLSDLYGKAIKEGGGQSATSPKEAADIYWDAKIKPEIDAERAIVIGADNLKDYFGNDYDDKNHPIYSEAAFTHLFDRALKETKGDTVVFTGGGPGSGKTDFLINTLKNKGFNGIIYDSNFSNPEGAKIMIEKARAAGKKVQINGIIADTDRAFEYTQAREKETGRGISVKTFATGHAGFLETAKILLTDGVVSPNEVHLYDLRNVSTPQDVRNLMAEGSVDNPLAVLKDVEYTKEDLIDKYKNRYEEKNRNSSGSEGDINKSRNGKADLSLSGEDRSDRGEGSASRGSGGPVLRSEEGRVEEPKESSEKNDSSVELGAGINPNIDIFLKEDVVPKVGAALKAMQDIWHGFVNLVRPVAYVEPKMLDAAMKMKGLRNQQEYIFNKTNEKAQEMFNKMPQAKQVDFIDRMKRGIPQETPALQVIADSLRQIDTAMWNEAKALHPSLAWKDNHFRVLWKEIPGAKEGDASNKGFKGIFRRPLQGTKGFTKQSTLIDLSEGLAKGGVPYTYNPIEMFSLAYSDMNKFITARKMIQTIKDYGHMKFVKSGGTIPSDFVRLDDSVAKVYMPITAETSNGKEFQTVVSMGEWYIQKDTGRILNNFLSKDLVRSSAIGRSLLGAKNLYTAVELSLSPFHAIFESGETIGSQIGLGIQKIFQGKFLAGAKDIAKSPIAPFEVSHLGGQAIKAMSQPDFLKTDAAKHFIKQFPDAKELLDDLFLGGGKLNIDEGYKTSTAGTFVNNLYSKNYIGAVLRAVPAVSELIQKPLFETYIPRLKIGTFLKEYSNDLVANEKDLNSGKVTRATLARQRWNFVEARFGEMNFDNLFWNRTFKSSLQVMLRSVTWKMGNIMATGGAAWDQGAEFVNATKEKRAPRLSPKMAWFLGMTVVTATLSTIIMKASTGKYPKTLKDMVYPVIDDLGNRVSIPTYWRDLFSLVHSPIGYAQSSFSGLFVKMIEDWENKDFYGTEIYDPNDPFYKKMLDEAVHLIPLPFSVSSAISFANSGNSVSKDALSFMGFSKAPGYINNTAIQNRIFDLFGQHVSGNTKTQDQSDLSKEKSNIRALYQAGNVDQANKLLTEMEQTGGITAQGKATFIKDADLPGDIRAFRSLPESDQRALIKDMSIDEMQRYGWYAIKSVKDNFSSISDTAKEFVDGAQNGTFKQPVFKKGQVISDDKGTPSYQDGSTTTQSGIINTVITYAKAIGTDPVTAFNRIFTGQKITKIENGAILVERMSFASSEAQRKEDAISQGVTTKGYNLDHVIPLEAGGDNSKDNLQLIPEAQWKKNTAVENFLGKELSAGNLKESQIRELSIRFKAGSGEILTPALMKEYKNKYQGKPLTSAQVFDYKNNLLN